MKILLTTLHAKYSHASLALPSLAVCCDAEEAEIVVREWTVNEPRTHLLRQIMAEKADLIAFSCYIWNIETVLQLAADIRKISENTIIVLGGPEASFGIFELMSSHPAVDFVVKGEGEAVFRTLVKKLLQAGNVPGPFRESAGLFADVENLFYRDGNDILSGPLSRAYLQLDSVPSPFLAGLVDMSKPLIYYETSRGCPFSCAFCLSSVEGQVRTYSMERIESDLGWLMERGTGQIKLVDRTFNYDAGRANRIWRHILEHNRCSHFHFEIAADLLTDENISLLRQVPVNTFRFEIGVQSTSQETLSRVERRADLQRIFENVRRLRGETAVELHLDLVAGLPGEDYAGLLRSLQQLAELKPHVIQIEPLKVLKGSPMREIAAREHYVFSETPPYMILKTPWLTYDDICRIETVGRLLDLFYNNGGFNAALTYMQEKMELAAMLDGMAKGVANESLAGRSSRRLYELFACLAGELLKDEHELALLHDALFYDYCLREVPLSGKLPEFAAGREADCSWPGRNELPPGLEMPAGSRVRLFRTVFARDYRSGKAVSGPVTATFVYASAEGQGLRVIEL